MISIICGDGDNSAPYWELRQVNAGNDPKLPPDMTIRMGSLSGVYELAFLALEMLALIKREDFDTA